MGIIIWLIVGGICGWLASLIMRTDAQQGILLNIVVGIIGAVIAASCLARTSTKGLRFSRSCTHCLVQSYFWQSLTWFAGERFARQATQPKSKGRSGNRAAFSFAY